LRNFFEEYSIKELAKAAEALVANHEEQENFKNNCFLPKHEDIDDLLQGLIVKSYNI